MRYCVCQVVRLWCRGKVEMSPHYTFQVSASLHTPEPQMVNDFIKNQISEKNREEIQGWFR